jgi:antitoxin component YwqK of YwqJK toxin-antitoxin module
MVMWWENGRKQYECLIVSGEPEGEALCWHENGQLAGRGVLKAGKRHGLWTTWDENGNKIDEMEFQMGTPHGRAVRWRPDGTKEYDGTYRDGQKDGVWTIWDGRQHREELWMSGKQVAE